MQIFTHRFLKQISATLAFGHNFVRHCCLCIAVSSDSCTSPRLQRTILIFLLCLGGCICLSIPLVLQAGIAKITCIRRVPQWRLASPAPYTFWFVTEWHQTQDFLVQSQRFISKFLLPSLCLIQNIPHCLILEYDTRTFRL